VTCLKVEVLKEPEYEHFVTLIYWNFKMTLSVSLTRDIGIFKSFMVSSVNEKVKDSEFFLI
jgi:hypothetical protein